MVAKQRILIVDDDENIAELISLYLTKECFETKIVYDGESALDNLSTFKPNLILLDLMLPGIDGYQVCREIRKNNNTPIIMLSAKGETFDKVLGLELGADDYIIKPFETKELVARVKAVLRRYHLPQTTVAPSENARCVTYPDLIVNLDNYSVTYDKKAVEMPPKELELYTSLHLHLIRCSHENSFLTISGAMITSAIPVLSMCTSNEFVKRLKTTINGRLKPYGELATNL